MYYRKPDKDRIIYLLHFTNTEGEVEHYAGTTARERLRLRLKEHRKGRTVPPTTKLRQRGYKISHFTIIPDCNEELEAMLKFEQVALLACPKCNPESDYNKCENYNSDRAPPKIAATERKTKTPKLLPEISTPDHHQQKKGAIPRERVAPSQPQSQEVYHSTPSQNEE